MGMLIANKIALDRNILNSPDYDIVQRLSKELLGKSILKDIPFNGLDKLLKKDKKTEGNFVNFAIIASIGDTRFLKLELNDALLEEIYSIKEDFSE
jgi:3-dehydroquinate synthetase